jgi:glucose-1-phosphate thymidylyltransferase
MKVLILAGGYGTRLYSIVKDRPKALLEVAGKTLIDHTVDSFSRIPGIEEIVVVTNAKFFDMLSAWGQARRGRPCPIRVVNDRTTCPQDRLGAMGDVLFVLGSEQTPTDWLVAGSDNLYDFDVAPFAVFASRVAPAVSVACFDLKDTAAATRYGVIQLDAEGRIVSLEEKPAKPKSSLISMCLYYYPAASLPLIRAFIDETNSADTTGGYIQWLYAKQSVYGLNFTGKWYDIGSVESYNEAQRGFLK